MMNQRLEMGGSGNPKEGFSDPDTLRQVVLVAANEKIAVPMSLPMYQRVASLALQEMQE